jgi:hypothetical protein
MKTLCYVADEEDDEEDEWGIGEKGGKGGDEKFVGNK